MREELDSLRGKIKQLNKKIKDEKKMRMEFELKSQVIQQQKSKSALMNQECDFEDCIDEECVEPAQTNKSQQFMAVNGYISAKKNSSENPLFLKLASSPQNSDLRRSMKEGAYLTPDKSSRSVVIQNMSQVIESKLQKMIDNCVKMECIGCRKLIPTHLFYEHITPATP